MSDATSPSKAELVTPTFLAIVLAGLVYWIGFNMVIPELPRFVTRNLGGSNLAVGLLVGAPALTAVFTRPIAGRLGNQYGTRC